MRPVKLELEGFTSFQKRAVIDFEGLDLFAITGPTGAGKSSILDAMLYGLFGCTPRIGEKEIPRLVSLGQNTVKVTFEFEAGGKRYRVARTRKTGKASVTNILLEEQTGEEWNSVAGSVKEIGERIQGILGLDFDGFTRSVILPQGEFDKFLRGDPKQRTEILKDLLGLRVYERMMRAANERDKALRIKADAFGQQLETTYADATQENLEKLEAQRQELMDQRAAQEKERQRLESILPVAQELKQVRTEGEQADAALAKARTELKEAEAGSAASEKTLAECERKLEDLEARLEAAGYDEAAWSELTQAVPPAKQQASLQVELAARRKDRQAKAASLPQLEVEARKAAESLEAARQARGEAQRKAGEAQQALEDFRKAHGSGDLIRARLEKLRKAEAAMAGLAAKEAVHSAVAEAEGALEYLQTLHAAGEIRRHVKAGDQCPVCEQTIFKVPEAAPVAALDEARKRLQAARAAQTAWQRAADQLADARSQAAGTAEELEARLEGVGALEKANSDLLRLSQEAQSAEAAAERKAQAGEQQLQLFAQQVASIDAEIKRAQEKLREAAAGLQQFPNWAPLPLSELEASLEEQNQAKRLRQELERQRLDAMNQRQRVTTAAMEHKTRRLSLENTISEKETQIDRTRAKAKELAATLRAQLLELAQGAEELAYVQAALRSVGAMANALQAKVATVEANIAQLRQRISESRRMREEIAGLRAEALVYHQLGKLLAANEFIAYVQRAALGRLASEASNQLFGLSRGQYTLTLSEDSNEFFVVDHWNASETRSVKTLSGGESFLASLALALALSEGLTAMSSDERARSRLDSLFIDEGISSLDAESLETAIAAIETLTSGNRMVGVISHVAELGERLPSRIRVEKSQSGSRVSVESHSHSMVAGGL
ncbi:MAG: SMC family ATPase [Bryobacterales bacterium]|nr:SMC family ATPase [Bryobacterales bacterium]